MAILNIQIGETGLVGVVPRVVYINTNDTLATVTTAGYLNNAVQQGYAFAEYDMALVSTKTSPSSAVVEVAWLEVSHSGDNWSLVPSNSPGEVVLPTIANHIAVYTNTTGGLSEDAATAINGGNIQAGLSGTAGYLASFPSTAARGSLRLTAVANTGDTVTTISNAAMGQASVISIPDPGAATANFLISASAGGQSMSGGLTISSGNLGVTLGNIAATLGSLAAGTTVIAGTGITATTGNIVASAGNVVAGATGAAGSVTSFSGTGSAEFLRLAAIDNAGGNFSTTISNASSVGQSQTISIPDAGAASANFLLDAGAANILAEQQFVGLSNVLTYGTGTWTVTRIAQGNYVARHTAADETSIIAIDITPIIRTTASKGFRLDSFDVIYSIGTLALDAQSVTLDRVEYANNVAVSVNSIAITGTLATATQANPYVTNVAVNTPAFDNTADSKYVIELTVNNSATSEYDFYGINLRFSQTIG